MERLIADVVQGANAISRPVTFSLHVCFAITYAAHVYRHRILLPRASWARALFLFPLRGGHRHAVFQVFAWGLWCLSAAITLPIYLSLLAANAGGTYDTSKDFSHKAATATGGPAAAESPASAHSFSGGSLLLSALGLQRPLIPLTHVDAASGAAAVSGLWGELFMLKALLVFEGAAARAASGRKRAHRRRRSLGPGPSGHSSATAHSEPRQRGGGGGDLCLCREDYRPHDESQSRAADSYKALGPHLGAADLVLGAGQGTSVAEEDSKWGSHQHHQHHHQQHQHQQLLAPRLASLLVCLMGMALSVTGFVLLLALEHMPDTASRVLYCLLALSCVFIGASSTHGLGGHLRYCAAGAAGSAGAALGVLRRNEPSVGGSQQQQPATVSAEATAAAAASATAAAAAIVVGGSGSRGRARSQETGAAACDAGGSVEASAGQPEPGGTGTETATKLPVLGASASASASASAAAAAATAAAAAGAGPCLGANVVRSSSSSASCESDAMSSSSSSADELSKFGQQRGGSLVAEPEPEAEAASEDEGEEVDGADGGPGWRFFQPFQGGSVFVATQAIGWTLFSSTVVAVLLLAKQLVAGVGYCLRCWALAAGALMMATQLVLGASLLTYQHRRQARKLLHHPKASLARAAGLVLPVVMMYLPLHVSCSCVAAVFVLLPARQAAVAVLAVLLPYFAVTLRGYPAHSGCRRWDWLCRWFSREVEGSLAWWAGQLEVVRDFPGTAHDIVDDHRRGERERVRQGEGARGYSHEQAGAGKGADGVIGQGRQREQEQAAAAVTSAGHLKQQQQQHPGHEATAAAGGSSVPAAAPPAPALPRRYVLGFHPHGLYPTGAGFLPLMPGVQAAFPGTQLVTLTASIVHYLPGLRDIAGWAGFRQVTCATFRRALHDTGAVLLCPGGQAELVYADRAFPTRGSPGAAAAAAAAAAPPSVPVVRIVSCSSSEESVVRPECVPSTAHVDAGATRGSSVQPNELNHGSLADEDPNPVDASIAAAADCGPARTAAAASTPATGKVGALEKCSATAPAAAATAVLAHAGGGAEGSQPGAQAVGPWGPVPLPVPRGGTGCGAGAHQLVIYAGHQGFVRLALEEGAWLVPVLALGETLQLRNLISAPDMQRATYKRIGFPVPFILAGRWGLTTLPLRNPLVYVIGRPIPPPAGWEAERLRQLQDPHPHPHRVAAAGHQHSHRHHHPTVTGRSGASEPTAAVCGDGAIASVGAAASSLAAAGAAPFVPRSRRGQLHRRKRSQGQRTEPQLQPQPQSSPLHAGQSVDAVAAPGGVSRAGVGAGLTCAGPAAAAAAAAAAVVVPQALVDEYHAAFYAALGELWARHRHRHPVLQHAELVFEWGPLGGPPGTRPV